jgi:hypothetical protein
VPGGSPEFPRAAVLPGASMDTTPDGHPDRPPPVPTPIRVTATTAIKVVLALLAGALPLAAVDRALAPRAASASVPTLAAHMEARGFSEFDQPNVSAGQLTQTRGHAYDGQWSALATYCGGGANGYARGVFAPRWPAGSDVWYGGAFLLPRGFHAAIQGEVALVRWDNYNLFGPSGDFGGVVIFGSDRRARVVRGHYDAGTLDQLGATFQIPEGRWVWLEVHERLGEADGALTEVYLDGQRVSSSTQPNSFGRPVDRIRYGLVAIASGAQDRPLHLWFDRAIAGGSQVGPLSSSARAAVPAPHRRGPRTPRTIGGCR